MKFDTSLCAADAATTLQNFIDRAKQETEEVVLQDEPAEIAAHFHTLRSHYNDLKEKLNDLENEVNKLSYEIIPTLFGNKGVTSLKLAGVGNVIVSSRWNASMVRRDAAMKWLRDNDAGGLIIETVNASTLASFAKERAMEGKPLPEDTFKVGTAPYTSIRRS